MFLSRKAGEEILSHIHRDDEHKQVLIVSGARQVGKTTLIQHLLKGRDRCVEINLQEDRQCTDRIDETTSFEEFEELLRFRYEFRPEGSMLFIDEAQNSAELGRYVRFMKERWKNTTVILSGSMMSDFFRDRYPVGRVREIVLRPLTFEEYLAAHRRDSLLDYLHTYRFGDTASSAAHRELMAELGAYFTRGGLPQVVLDAVSKEDWRTTRSSITEGFRNDFALRYGAEKANDMWRAFRSVGQHLGSPSKFTQVVRSSEPGYKSVPQLFAQLEDWDLVLSAEQRGNQPEKNLHPKRYLFDVGIAQEFRYGSRPLPLLESSSSETKKALGGLLENFIATSLVFLEGEISGYRERNYEIDFITRTSGDVIPLEVKASSRNKLSQLSSVTTYCEQYDLRLGIALNLAPPQKVERENRSSAKFLPAYLIEQLPRLVGEISA
ncbi:AAA family ATPase [bacterium]|nr:AAA family ATPase [bacterium]